MEDSIFDMKDIDNAWCPGCGNFALHRILKQSLEELGKKPEECVFVSGIGQAAKLPQYTKGNMFNGLHGRGLPVAMAIKAANPELTVIVDSGDGCIYNEGGNHFTHQILRNADITVIAHNNMVYGLTKGQASPTSLRGFTTPVQVDGVATEPFNPLTQAIAQDASFVARAFVRDADKAKEIFKEAIKNEGFSLVDVFCPCVSFNKFNTYQWYKEHTYYMDEEEPHDPTDKLKAFNRAMETGSYPLGVFYTNNKKTAFWKTTAAYKNDKRPLWQREVDMEKLKNLIAAKRT